MAQPSSQVPRSSHITTEGNFASDGAYPTNEDRICYPELFTVTQETGYCTEEQHMATLLTISGETHLVQGAPNFLNSPAVPNRPTRPPVHARSLTPAIIGIIHSAFPNTSYMEYKGLANDLMELINSHKKESRQHIAQQEC